MFSALKSNLWRTPKTRWRVSIIVLVVLLIVCAGHATYVHRTSNTEDFGIFFHAADALRHGADPYEATEGHYIYPPLLAFVLQPLAFLSEENAALVWTLLSAGFIFAGAWLVARRAITHWSATADSSLPWLIAALATLLMVDKVHTILMLGQTDSLMLFGFVLAFYWMQDRPLLAGAAVGFTASVKYLSLIFVLYFLLKRNFRAAFSSLAAFVFFMLLPTVQVGWPNEQSYLSLTSRGMARMIGALDTQRRVKVLKVTWDRSVSLTSAVFRFTRAQGLPDPVAVALILLLFAALIAALLFICRRGPKLFRLANTGPALSLEWSALVIVTLIFSPQSTSRHLFLLLIPYAIALAIIGISAASSARRWLIGSLLLTALATSFPIPFIELWRNIGGASWCAALLLLAMAWNGRYSLGEGAASRR